jgi:hypothetical protein
MKHGDTEVAKLELNNGKWNVVSNGQVLGTFDSIKDAQDFKFELSRKPAAKVIYWMQDGTEVTKRPSRRAA